MVLHVTDKFQEECWDCGLPWIRGGQFLSGLPSANAKSQRFSYVISQIASLPLAVALNRNADYRLFVELGMQAGISEFMLLACQLFRVRA